MLIFSWKCTKNRSLCFTIIFYIIYKSFGYVSNVRGEFYLDTKLLRRESGTFVGFQNICFDLNLPIFVMARDIWWPVGECNKLN